MRFHPEYHPTLYVSEGITAKKLDKIKKKLEKRPFTAGVFIIALSRGNDLLDIYKTDLLLQSYYRSHPPYIVGIAETQKEAVLLVEEMVRDCMKARGDCALKEYLSC